MEERRFQIGIELTDHVHLVENHDEVYHLWGSSGMKHRVLIHIDAHHDLGWFADPNHMDIANFIWPALKENIVREFFWVVPDPAWETPESRKSVIRHLKKITERCPGACDGIQVKKEQISTVVLGKPAHVCLLDSLPRIDETVLLDIDTDFLVIPRVSFGKRDVHRAIPWCWPDELLDRLRVRDICADFVTIAYSVEGGYTPLRWKYLGDELAIRLQPRKHPERKIKGMTLMREAALAANNRSFAVAEEKYHEANKLLPDSPAPYYHLGHLYVEMDQSEKGQKFYRQALALDSSYRTPYNNAGVAYYWDGRLREAEQEYLRVLAVDPQDAFAYFGLGRLAAEKKRSHEAELWLRKALDLDRELMDAYRVLGDVLVKMGRHEEAIMAYEQCLKLALSGRKSVDGPIATQREGIRLLDPYHWKIHARRARLLQLKGQIGEAIHGYRISIAGKYDGVLVRSRLAYLYLKQSQWRKAAKEALQTIKMIPADIWKGVGRVHRNLRWAVRCR